MNILQEYKLRALRRTDRLTIAVVILGVVILIGLVTYQKPTLSYKITTEQILEEAAKDSHISLPSMLPKLLENDTYKIIDCRNSIAYNQGHIENAIHIPKHNLLNKKNLALFENQSYTYLLYGNNTSEANSLWMLLKQLGYDNVIILASGYNKNGEETLHSRKYNYSKLMKEATARNRISSQEGTSQRKKQTSKKVLPKKKAKKHHTDGGC